MIKTYLKKIKNIFSIKLLLLLLLIVVSIFTILYFIDYNRKIEEQKIIESEKRSEKILLDSLSIAKYLPNTDGQLSNIGIKEITLKCKFLEGEMYYSLNASYVNKNDSRFPLKLSTSYGKHIAIELRDKDVFNVHTIEIPLQDLIRTSDDNGDCIGFRYDGNQRISKEKYMSFSNWGLTWYF